MASASRKLNRSTVEVAGYRGRTLRNHLVRQGGPAAWLAIVFPGLGYTCDMPLLYYATCVLTAAGADVLQVHHDYRSGVFSTLSPEDQLECVAADALASYRDVSAPGTCSRVTLVGKSLGTIALATLATSGELRGHVEAAWLTPTLKTPELTSRLRGWSGRSLVVAGDADPHFDRDILAELEGQGDITSVIVPGADHALETPDGPTANLGILTRVMDALDRFVR
ncbi:hypothetical protein [Sorangium sp. So ce1078]|uniref:hypothetical protein n=1 Tax=Sorangium sp. So ce1078 TaxID=3133329 RepID=UPI003F627B50